MDYIPWNSPGQNTGVGSLSRLQGIFPTQVSHIAVGFFTSWATREQQQQQQQQQQYLFWSAAWFFNEESTGSDTNKYFLLLLSSLLSHVLLFVTHEL